MKLIYDFIVNTNIKHLLDIGANKGEFSYFLKSNIRDLDIFMIEANPFCESLLRQTGIFYKIACLSDTEKEIDFFLEDTNDVGTGASYYIEKTRFYSQKRSIKLKTKRLDDIIEEIFGPNKTFDIIKIDTQGSEIDIMKGGQKTLERAKFVIAETSLMEYNENSPMQEEFFRYMELIGFKPKEKIEDHYHQGKVIQEDWIFENKNI